MKKIYLLLGACVAFITTNAQNLKTFHPDATIPLKFMGESKPLKDLPEASDMLAPESQWPIHDNPTLEHNWIKNIKPNPNALPNGNDPALQQDYTASSSPAATTLSVVSNWAGLSAGVQPSDNTLAVSSSFVMQMTNNSTSTYIKVWNKAGTVLVNNKKVSSITGINDYGDPNIIYDWQADRFVFVVLYGATANKLVVCVSKTNDPTGAWYSYNFVTANGFPDYPKIGVWGNSYYITTNSNTPTIFALNRSAMLAGTGTGTVQYFKLARFSVGFQSSSPVTFTGSTAAPSTVPAMVVRPADDSWGTAASPDHLEIFQLNIDWANSANSTITGPIKLNTTAWASKASNAPMPGVTRKLDVLDYVIMDKVQYINTSLGEFIVASCVSNADGTGKAAPRWYILKKDASGNFVINQQSTYSPDATYRFMSTMSMNSRGTVALGYNASSSSVYPSQRVTGRAYCDAANTMTVTEKTLAAGTAANGSTRYGDYNALVVDPSDGSFWLTSNYNPTTAWKTNVSHFTITPCPEPIVVKTSVISSLKAMPIPASSNLNLSFNAAGAMKAIIAVNDLYGNKLITREIQTTEGINAISLDVSGLNTGNYIVLVISADGEAVKLPVEIRH